MPRNAATTNQLDTALKIINEILELIEPWRPRLRRLLFRWHDARVPANLRIVSLRPRNRQGTSEPRSFERIARNDSRLIRHCERLLAAMLAADLRLGTRIEAAIERLRAINVPDVHLEVLEAGFTGLREPRTLREFAHRVLDTWDCEQREPHRWFWFLHSTTAFLDPARSPAAEAVETLLRSRTRGPPPAARANPAAAAVAIDPSRVRHPLEAEIKLGRGNRLADKVLPALFRAEHHELPAARIQELSGAHDADDAVRSAYNAVRNAYPEAAEYLSMRVGRSGESAVYLRESARTRRRSRKQKR